jgi:hypothetical protein
MKAVLLIFLTILGIEMFYKGIELLHLGTDVDGDGIGIHYLGIEMAESLNEQNIPKAATAFLVV